MNRKHCRIPAVCAALLAALALAGCMKYDKNLDLSATVHNALLDGAADVANRPTLPDSNNPSNAAFDVNAPLDVQTEPSSEEPGSDTTPGVIEPTVQTVTPAQYVQTLGTTEYDVLRSNNFTMQGAFHEGSQTTPITMAITTNQIYVTSEVDGLQLGIHVNGKKMNIYLPAQKKYLEMNSAVAKLLQMDPDEFTSMADELGFDKLPSLASAESISDGTVNGVKCKIFYIRSTDGTEALRVYLAGTKLLAIEYLDSTGTVTSSMTFSSVQAGFPQMPPSGYSKMSYFEFAKQLMNEMG